MRDSAEGGTRQKFNVAKEINARLARFHPAAREFMRESKRTKRERARTSERDGASEFGRDSAEGDALHQF